MKIKMEIEIIKTGSKFEETYEIENNLNPNEYAENLITNFNHTLRPGESPRKLLGVIVLDNSDVKHKHDWRKTNLATITRGGMSYDKMICTRCGVTGKRYGFSSVVKRDSKYKAKIYDTCEDATKQMKKLRERRNKANN
ncbi:MAG: hypothetical protein N4A63_13800 [Vallitalea sp.]|jgi:hypothetical protein|nr:hypothetical protein [Vallitalea sp.]